MSQDFGYRSHAESKMLDLLGSVLEINHAISHLRRWMKPSRRSTELLFLSNSVKVHVPAQGRGRRDRAVELPDLPGGRPARSPRSPPATA